MRTVTTPAVRIRIAATVAATALAFATQARADTITLGDSGWEATWDSTLDGLVDIDFIGMEGNVVFIQKSAEFTQGPVNGVFPTIAITFRQVSDSTVTNIVIDDEIVTNNTGATWGGFVMKAIDGGDVSFNPTQTAASGGTGPIGFSINPFTTAEFVKDNTKLKISGGLVNDGSQWFPGGGASDGQLWLDVHSGGAEDRTIFTLKERPTVFIIPGPSALLAMAGGMFMMGRGRRRS